MPRKPAYLQAETVSSSRWLISYTDIVTVLLILFVAVAAQGLQDHPVKAATIVAPPPSALRRFSKQNNGCRSRVSTCTASLAAW
jgi:hypothetical protein